MDEHGKGLRFMRIQIHMFSLWLEIVPRREIINAQLSRVILMFACVGHFAQLVRAKRADEGGSQKANQKSNVERELKHWRLSTGKAICDEKRNKAKTERKLLFQMWDYLNSSVVASIQPVRRSQDVSADVCQLWEGCLSVSHDVECSLYLPQPNAHCQFDEQKLATFLDVIQHPFFSGLCWFFVFTLAGYSTL